ncbi:MAG: PKD domain-containing protein, partial [Rhodoferax sp.]
MAYSTATQKGVTNAKGEFQYLPGESVRFSIGSVELPAVTANATITPLELAQTTDINNQVVSNILVLLQSLDEDGNPDNGISIPAGAAAKAITAINFDVAPAVFAADATVKSLVANSGSVNKSLVSEAAARAHFQNTLNGSGGTAKINVAPVANAGSAQSVTLGTKVTLDGSASSDANGDSLSYAWTLSAKPSGSSASLASASTVKPTFTPDVAGTYVASLVVNDGQLSSSASTVTVTAVQAVVALTYPVVDSGQTQTFNASAAITAPTVGQDFYGQDAQYNGTQPSYT